MEKEEINILHSDYTEAVGVSPCKKAIVITQAVGMMFKDVGGNIAVWNFKEEDLADIGKLVVNGYEFTLTAKVDKFGRKVNM